MEIKDGWINLNGGKTIGPFKLEEGRVKVECDEKPREAPEEQHAPQANQTE